MSDVLVGDDVIVWDVETTGLEADDQLLQIGAIRVNLISGESNGCFNLYVRPEVPIKPQATRIHGILWDDVADAPSQVEAVREFFRWVGDVRVLWAHNAAFDVGKVNAVLARDGFYDFVPGERPFPEIRKIVVYDTLDLVRNLNPNMVQYKLDVIMQSMNIFVGEQHDALEDSIALANVLGRIWFDLEASDAWDPAAPLSDALHGRAGKWLTFQT